MPHQVRHITKNLIYDPLSENLPNRQLLQNELEARKVDTVITAFGDIIFLNIYLY